MSGAVEAVEAHVRELAHRVIMEFRPNGWEAKENELYRLLLGSFEHLTTPPGIMSGAVEGVALLPCPFCGGEAHHPTIKTRTGEEVCLTVVWCKGCEIEMHNGLDEIPRAAEQWNTRTTPPARSYADGVEDAAKAAERWIGPKADISAGNLPAAIRLLSQGGKA